MPRTKQTKTVTKEELFSEKEDSVTKKSSKKNTNSTKITVADKKVTKNKPLDDLGVKEEKPIPKGAQKCDLCNNYYSFPTIIRLEALTGKASWHRECAQNKFYLCSECAEQLNKLVDDFILKKRPDLNKFK